jgi:hypothetical protein
LKSGARVVDKDGMSHDCFPGDRAATPFDPRYESFLYPRMSRGRPRHGGVGVRLRCDAGDIVSFDSAGLMLRANAPWPPSEVRPIAIESDTEHLEVEAACLWCHRPARGATTIGVRFVNLTIIEEDAILELARQATRGIGPHLF